MIAEHGLQYETPVPCALQVVCAFCTDKTNPLPTQYCRDYSCSSLIPGWVLHTGATRREWQQPCPQALTGASWGHMPGQKPSLSLSECLVIQMLSCKMQSRKASLFHPQNPRCGVVPYIPHSDPTPWCCCDCSWGSSRYYRCPRIYCKALNQPWCIGLLYLHMYSSLLDH